MSDHSEDPEVVASAANSVEAAAIVTALAGYGIEASTIGGFTASFIAEAPGEVQVIVKKADAEPARAALAEIRKDSGGSA